MTRSAEFGSTVKSGVRAVEADIVVHAKQCEQTTEPGPRIGLVVGKSVGSAVQRHRVARRLRDVVRHMITEVDPTARIVIRALPGSRHVISARLEQELRSGLARAHVLGNGHR
jgi:ribonuclease P protein component